MVWCVKYLQYRVQIPRTHTMFGVAVWVCNSSTPLLRCKASTGEPLESPKPASLTSAAGSKRLCLIQGGGNWQPRIFFNFCTYLPTLSKWTHTHIHTLTQMNKHTHKWTYSHTYIHIQMHTHTHMHTYKWIYIHTQIKTHWGCIWALVSAWPWQTQSEPRNDI